MSIRLGHILKEGTNQVIFSILLVASCAASWGQSPQPPHQGPIPVNPGPQSVVIAVNAAQGEATVFSTTPSPRALGTFPIRPNTSGAFACPNSTVTILPMTSGDAVQIWKGNPNKVPDIVGNIRGPVKVFFDANCLQAVILGNNGFIYRFDVNAETVIQTATFTGSASFQNAILSPDSKTIYAIEAMHITAVDFATLNQTQVAVDGVPDGILVYTNAVSNVLTVIPPSGLSGSSHP